MKTLIFFFLACQVTFAQKNKSKTVDELKPLGRAKLIQMAVERVQSGYPQFDPKNFDRVNVYIDGSRLIVRFDVAVKFIPKNTCAYYTVVAELTRRSLGMIPFGDVEKCTKENFFVPDQQSNNHIELIKKKLPGLIPDEVGKDEEIVIREFETYYSVGMEGSSYSHGFKLDKTSLRKYDEFDGMKMPYESKKIEIE